MGQVGSFQTVHASLPHILRLEMETSITLRELEILNIIKRDPLITNPELARRVGLKPRSIKAILRRLSTSGFIKSVVIAPGVPGGRHITILKDVV